MPYPTDKPKAVVKKPAAPESSEDSESDAPIVQKKAAPANNLPAKKNFVKSENHSLKPDTVKKPEVKHVAAPLNKRAAESSEDDDSDEPKPKVKAPAPEKKVKGAPAKKPVESDDEDSDEAPAKMKNELPKAKPAPAKPVLPAPKKPAAPVESDDEDSDEKPAPKKAAPAMKNELPQKKAVPAPVAKKPVAPASSDEDSDDAPAPPKKAAAPSKPAPAPVKKPAAPVSDDSDSDEKPAPKKAAPAMKNELPQRKGSDAKKQAPAAKKPAKEESEDEDSDDAPAPPKKAAVVAAKPAPVKKQAAKPASDDEDSSDEKPAPKKAAPAKPAPAPVKKTAAPVQESDSDDDDEDEAPAPKKAAPAKPAPKKAAAPVEEDEDELEVETPAQKPAFQRAERGGAQQRGGRDNGYVDKNANEIIVKGLNYTVTEDQIWERFGQFGTVSSVKCLSKDDGTFRGMCFIKMADQDGVEAAVAATGSDFLGRSMWIEKTRPKSEREAQFNSTGGYDSWQQKGARGGQQHGGDRQGGFQRNQGGAAGGAGGEKFHTNQDSTIFVGNLSFNTREDSVWSAFESVGNLKEVRIAKDAEGRSRGFAHVEFHDVESATKGIGMTGTEIDGRAIRCDSSTGKSGGGGRGGAGGRGGFGGGRGGRGGNFRQHEERPTHSGDAFVDL